ncbi:ATP-binding protein [Methyloferula stellata]|uniref:ATP-binding protein n=1 Tax=Methyloferula stellata TaxID=876270 RepID=UPI00039F5F2D|nr:ATP-binding protein [Methyloferula stellata]
MRQIVLENALGELDRLTNFTREIGDETGLAADRIFALELCLEEAVVNIITHGGSHPDKRITVTLMNAVPAVTIRIEDNGEPFDPTQVPPPPPPASLDDAVPGGQGIPLIRKLASEMRYEYAGGINRLTLVFAPRTLPPEF